MTERIAKRMARSGICSRREAERWINSGRVLVDGQLLSSPALNVTEENVIYVDGKILPEAEKTKLWLFHKPDGIITTHNDPEKRKTVFDILPEDTPRVISIGRLDINTEGLLLLTNNGELSRYIELPETGWVRRYRVRVYGNIDEKHLKSLKHGVTIKDEETGKNMRYDNIYARIDGKKEGRNSWIVISIKEGKNREIRKICRSMNLHVNRLIRTNYGPFSLEKLKVGELQKVPRKSMKKHFADFL